MRVLTYGTRKTMTDSTVGFVLGTRPEIIKLAPVIQECHRRGVDTHIIHTGQHYSDSLDTVFFPTTWIITARYEPRNRV